MILTKKRSFTSAHNGCESYHNMTIDQNVSSNASLLISCFIVGKRGTHSILIAQPVRTYKKRIDSKNKFSVNLPYDTFKTASQVMEDSPDKSQGISLSSMQN